MGSPALVDLQARILSNTLTPSQQAALADALSVIAPVFPQPDDVSSVAPIARVSQEWIGALFTINAGGGDMPPSSVVTDVVGTPPIDATVDGVGVATVSITPATDAAAGSMSAADKTKLDGLTPGVTSIAVDAPLVKTGPSTSPTISLPDATDADAGAMSAADKTKLDGLTPAPPGMVNARNVGNVDFTTGFVLVCESAAVLTPGGKAFLALSVPIEITGAAGLTVQIVPGADENAFYFLPSSIPDGDGNYVLSWSGPIIFVDPPVPGPHTFNFWVSVVSGTVTSAIVPDHDGKNAWLSALPQ